MPTPQAENEVLSLATHLELSEKSRLGFARKLTVQEPGLLFANLQSTLGMHVSLPENCDGSRIETWNRYAYVANNPLNATDALGLAGITQFSNGCGQDASCWNAYRDAVMQAHQGGVNQGPAANWGALDSLSFTQTPTTTASNSSELLNPLQWNPPQLTNLSNGNVQITTGGWSSSTITGIFVPGVMFTQTSGTTWTFTSQSPFQQTVQNLKNAGFVENRADYTNFFHPGQLDLRDKQSMCSLHVAVKTIQGVCPGRLRPAMRT